MIANQTGNLSMGSVAPSALANATVIPIVIPGQPIRSAIMSPTTFIIQGGGGGADPNANLTNKHFIAAAESFINNSNANHPAALDISSNGSL